MGLISVVFLAIGVGTLIGGRGFDETWFYLSALFAIACGVNKNKDNK